jgi:hypothetical protein
MAAVPHPRRPRRVDPSLAGAVGGVRRGAGASVARILTPGGTWVPRRVSIHLLPEPASSSSISTRQRLDRHRCLVSSGADAAVGWRWIRPIRRAASARKSCTQSCLVQPVAQMLRRPILRDQPVGQGRITALHRHDQSRLGFSRLAERSISPRETASDLCDRLSYVSLGSAWVNTSPAAVSSSPHWPAIAFSRFPRGRCDGGPAPEPPAGTALSPPVAPLGSAARGRRGQIPVPLRATVLARAAAGP